METPGMDQGYDLVNVARARELLAGRRLEPLPAAAFQLHGSRSIGVAPAPDDAEAEGTGSLGDDESAVARVAPAPA
jgi:hypothetical protein